MVPVAWSFVVDPVTPVSSVTEPVSLLSPAAITGAIGVTLKVKVFAVGSILVFGAVLPPERRQMSMIFQSYAIWPNMTVEQNVAFGLELRKIAKAEVKRRVGEILEVVRMSHLGDRYPAELSGGPPAFAAPHRAAPLPV